MVDVARVKHGTPHGAGCKTGTRHGRGDRHKEHEMQVMLLRVFMGLGTDLEMSQVISWGWPCSWF